MSAMTMTTTWWSDLEWRVKLPLLPWQRHRQRQEKRQRQPNDNLIALKSEAASSSVGEAGILVNARGTWGLRRVAQFWRDWWQWSMINDHDPDDSDDDNATAAKNGDGDDDMRALGVRRMAHFWRVWLILQSIIICFRNMQWTRLDNVNIDDD